jgi:hypothetical protein
LRGEKLLSCSVSLEGGLCLYYTSLKVQVIDSLARLHSCRGQKVNIPKFFPDKILIFRVPNPAVLQFLEVNTPSSIQDIDGMEEKQPKNHRIPNLASCCKRLWLQTVMAANGYG